MTVKSCWRELDYSFVEKNTNNTKCFLSILFAGFYIVADSVSTYYEGCDGGEMWCDKFTFIDYIWNWVRRVHYTIEISVLDTLCSSVEYRDLIRGRDGERPAQTSCVAPQSGEPAQVSQTRLGRSRHSSSHPQPPTVDISCLSMVFCCESNASIYCYF